MRNFDIAIIGGSFSGMTAALSLANISSDLKIAVIEKNDIINIDRKRDGRGYAISNSSLKLFDEIGILEKVKVNAGIIKDIRITDYKSMVVLDFLSKDVSEENFGFLIESFEIHNALRNKLIKTPNIKIYCPNSYDNIIFENNSAEITLDNNEKISAKIFLACDGRFSDLRSKFNISTKIKKYDQTAIVFNIWHSQPHKNIAWERFMPKGPIAILPLKDQHNSSVVWIVSDEQAEPLKSLEDNSFEFYLNRKIENCLGEIKLISDKYSYPLILAQANNFFYKKMILVGDAACGIHPIAGQGLNLGISSVIIFRDLVKKYFYSGLDINSDILIEEYNRLAKFNSRKMVIATDLINSIFETKNIAIKVSRNIGLGIVKRISLVKKLLIKNAGGF